MTPFARNRLSLCLLMCVATLWTACSHTNGTLTNERDKLYEHRCKAAPLAVSLSGSRRGEAAAPSQETTLKGFSRESIAVAEMLDLAPIIGHMPVIESDVEQKRVGAELRLVSLRQEVLQAILLATLDVSSAAAEVRCEQARADRLADELENNRSRRYARLTLTGLIVTALTSVVTGGLTLTGDAAADGIAAVIGGALGGLFGGLALWDADEHRFDHPRNHLKEIWEGPDESKVFPRLIWRFLNRPGTDKDHPKSLREQLIDDWRGKGRLGDPDSDGEKKRIPLLFGQGGAYSIEDLRARTEMLDELETTIDLFHEGLERFAHEAMKKPMTFE